MQNSSISKLTEVLVKLSPGYQQIVLNSARDLLSIQNGTWDKERPSGLKGGAINE